jgi:hypothetical protein
MIDYGVDDPVPDDRVVRSTTASTFAGQQYALCAVGHSVLGVLASHGFSKVLERAMRYE